MKASVEKTAIPESFWTIDTPGCNSSSLSEIHVNNLSSDIEHLYAACLQADGNAEGQGRSRIEEQPLPAPSSSFGAGRYQPLMGPIWKVY